MIKSASFRQARGALWEDFRFVLQPIAVLLISRAGAVEVGKPSKTSISSAAGVRSRPVITTPASVTRTGWRRYSSVRENEKSSLRPGH